MLSELFDHAMSLPPDSDPDVHAEAWEAVLTHPGFASLPVPERWSALAALGTCRLQRHQRDGRLEDLASALACLENALRLPSVPRAQRALASFNLFHARDQRYALTGEPDDLLTAMQTLWALVDEPVPGTSARGMCRTICGRIDAHAGELTDPLRGLRRAALERLLTDPTDPDLPSYQLCLASQLASTYEGSPAAHRALVVRAMELTADAERRLPEGEERHAASVLLAGLRNLHSWAEENAPAERAPGPPGRMDIEEFSDGLRDLPDHGARLARIREALATNTYETTGTGWILLNVLLAEEVLSPRTNGKIDTEEAITALRTVLGLPETDGLGVTLELKVNLGIAYDRRLKGDAAANAAEALAIFEQCASEVTPDHPRYPAVVCALAQALLDEADISGRRDGIERAIALCRGALDSMPADAEPALRANLLNTVVRLLPLRTTGDPEHNSEEAIRAAHEALDLLDPATEAVRRGDVHHNLARLYRDRLSEGREANLWRAIEHFRASLAAQPKDEMPVDWAMSQSSLGVVYSMMRGRDVEATQRMAIQAFMAAQSVFTLEDNPQSWATAEFNLGVAFGDSEVRARPDLERAITHLTSALQVFTEEAAPWQWAITQSFLGVMRTQTGTPEQLLAAADHFRAALRVLTFENHPRDWTSVQLNLAQLEPPEDLAVHRRMIRGLVGRGHRNEAFKAYMIYLRHLGDRGDWPAAAEAGARAAELHESLYQEALLRQSRHMEQQAAARDVLEIVTAMVRAGRTLDAVLLLERTRARELGESLQQDQDVLRSARDGDRVAFDAYRAACDRLTALAGVERSMPGAGFGAADVERLHLSLVRSISKARREQAAALARLTAAAEALRPPGIGELSAAAPPHRPLVYVYGAAGFVRLLLVRRDGEGGLDVDSRAVDLRDLPAGPDHSPPVYARLTAALAAWLRELGVGAVTLVACGALAGRPLHAFLHDGRCLLDEFTVSYAPSAAVLARRPAARPGPAVLAAVGDPTDDLHYASAEAGAVGALFPWCRRTVRYGAAATAPVFVREDVPGATHVHLACHGSFDTASPLESAFVLAAGTRMTLRAIMSGRAFRGVRLVFASACRTATTDAFLPDEAIGLASGLLQAGAREVIASLWNVNDLATMLVATRFYRELDSGPPGGGAVDAGRALRRAQLWLRDSTAAELSRWCAGLIDDVPEEPARSRLRAAVAHLDGRPPELPCYADARFWAAFVHLGG
ncbi:MULTISPECIES: CHAT domain-containing protein [Streptomyces]|uniref:CHAT domain-containing protein n=1 Tax=Streptomyces TaxID=1883 RepID=UPI002257202B|nr:CHAT domain-containing protein [Streptomyces sp. NBC_00160]MCX5307870.1 CHAT domain-containing protein [Streptomyces sp. NBC_00160]